MHPHCSAEAGSDLKGWKESGWGGLLVCIQTEQERLVLLLTNSPKAETKAKQGMQPELAWVVVFNLWHLPKWGWVILQPSHKVCTSRRPAFPQEPR